MESSLEADAIYVSTSDVKAVQTAPIFWNTNSFVTVSRTVPSTENVTARTGPTWLQTSAAFRL